MDHFGFEPLDGEVTRYMTDPLVLYTSMAMPCCGLLACGMAILEPPEGCGGEPNNRYVFSLTSARAILQPLGGEA